MTQLLSSGEFCKLRCDTVPVKSAYANVSFYTNIISIFHYALQLLGFIVRSELDVPTFVTMRLHMCHHERAPSSGRWNCGQEVSGNFA
jgi:hypothetical protein